MDSHDKKINFPRAKKKFTLELGTPNTSDYLLKEYNLPDPYTLGEYTKALDDLKESWEAGERTPQDTKGGAKL